MPKTIVNKASAVWNGELFSGSGTTSLDTSGAATLNVSWKARGEESGSVTTPEELIASAHATCYAMQFSNMLTENGTPPTQLKTGAEVDFVAGSGITGIRLFVVGTVDNISAEDFAKIAEQAKEQCPVSQALKAVDITLTASLAS